MSLDITPDDSVLNALRTKKRSRELYFGINNIISFVESGSCLCVVYSYDCDVFYGQFDVLGRDTMVYTEGDVTGVEKEQHVVNAGCELKTTQSFMRLEDYCDELDVNCIYVAKDELEEFSHQRVIITVDLLQCHQSQAIFRDLSLLFGGFADEIRGKVTFMNELDKLINQICNEKGVSTDDMMDISMEGITHIRTDLVKKRENLIMLAGAIDCIRDEKVQKMYNQLVEKQAADHRNAGRNMHSSLSSGGGSRVLGKRSIGKKRQRRSMVNVSETSETNEWTPSKYVASSERLNGGSRRFTRSPSDMVLDSGKPMVPSIAHSKHVQIGNTQNNKNKECRNKQSENRRRMDLDKHNGKNEYTASYNKSVNKSVNDPTNNTMSDGVNDKQPIDKGVSEEKSQGEKLREDDELRLREKEAVSKFKACLMELAKLKMQLSNKKLTEDEKNVLHVATAATKVELRTEATTLKSINGAKYKDIDQVLDEQLKKLES